MGRKRLFVFGLIGAVVTSLGAVAAPPPPVSPAPAPAPLAQVLVAVVQDIAEGVAALHRALPLIAPRLEPIEAILKGLREAIRDREGIEPKDIQVELLKLGLHLHRLLFDLEQSARELAEFRDSVNQFVDRFTERMDPRTARQFREFAQELLDLIHDKVGERRPGGANPAEVGRIVQELRVAVNRLDLLLLRSLEGPPAEK
ncbi:MAG: hypothetical protein BIP78_0105 [Candidatus Bipolaricaulis sibiricus]|uniref:Uncharacterized protein n=1 Tax=Bipolaricaulis sibiricus TaxID=2501609 RepID=A0A410FS64_BIPS1|nr:MAG: hypothetical protein BIP78_0105 [Candidatus Bipolaricaulis sibiricus]